MLEWLAQNVGDDLLTEIISLNDHTKRTIFHDFISSPRQSNSGPKLLSTLRFIKTELKLGNNLSIGDILFCENDDVKSVFSSIFEQTQEKAFVPNFCDFLASLFMFTDHNLKKYLIKIHCWIASIGVQSRNENFYLFLANLKKSFFTYCPNEAFHEICAKFNVENFLIYLNLIVENCDLTVFKNNISGKNSKEQTILFHFRHESDLIKMLEWFRTKFENDKKFLDKFLLQVDENSDSFLTFALTELRDDSNFDNFFIGLYDFLVKNFDKVFVREFLLLENSEGKNWLNIIFLRYGRFTDITKILDTLFENFQNDQEFFIKLFNEKSRKNRRVKEFMKDKFNVDSPEDQICRINPCEIC
jgi:hypothetical protein